MTDQLNLAGMAELADAADLKSAGRKVMGVRAPLPVPNLRFYNLRKSNAGDQFLRPADSNADSNLGGR